ncbi:hypothetical protein PGIGA_G00080010 [Pangasianodon gigas]|uniref:Uncharacterized protein n=1 Tax=Pangasianodon gigas TaxID=30993 RepID=A0ACC5X9Z2_PANGG|nr:hypothetical protein [Pangasianodon gigas]
MAALASSLIRQKRAVKEDQANRPIANKRRPCPKSNKSLCQKQILVLISKVRLCGGRRGRTDKRPGKPVSITNCLVFTKTFRMKSFPYTHVSGQQVARVTCGRGLPICPVFLLFN